LGFGVVLPHILYIIILSINVVEYNLHFWGVIFNLLAEGEPVRQVIISIVPQFDDLDIRAVSEFEDDMFFEVPGIFEALLVVFLIGFKAIVVEDSLDLFFEAIMSAC
jgi:hypothetical protein